MSIQTYLIKFIIFFIILIIAEINKVIENIYLYCFLFKKFTIINNKFFFFNYYYLS